MISGMAVGGEETVMARVICRVGMGRGASLFLQWRMHAHEKHLRDARRHAQAGERARGTFKAQVAKREQSQQRWRIVW